MIDEYMYNMNNEKNTAFSLTMTELPFFVPLVKSTWKVVEFVHIF